MNKGMIEEMKIQGKVVIITTEKILTHFHILDHDLGSLNLILSIIMSTEEKRWNINHNSHKILNQRTNN